MCQTLANGGTCQKDFLTSSLTTSTAQSGKQPGREKQSRAVAAVFTHKRTITFVGIRL
jgi:hypothetical protein